MNAYNQLPENYKAILQAACAQSTHYMSAKYDMLNPAALKRIVASGTKLRKYPTELLEKFYDASQEVYADICKKNQLFKDIFKHQEAYKKETALWLRFSDAHFDHFMMNHPLKEIF
jgi:TRAP-type mannitol/chloroaromatic compound transport system substrate-binding protein